jgi:uncharacterized protein (DUF433 family)
MEPPVSADTTATDMAIVDTAIDLVTRQTPGEKAVLLQHVARELGDAYPGIDSNAAVCGGEPCIERTRIPVWLLEQGRRTGVSEAELLSVYLSLRAEDLVNAWAYVRSHSAKIEGQIRANEEA